MKRHPDGTIEGTPEEIKEYERTHQTTKTSGRANPIRHGNDYVCDKCGVGCYYDGRMGDGAILMCKCNAAEDAYWAGDRR